MLNRPFCSNSINTIDERRLCSSPAIIQGQNVWVSQEHNKKTVDHITTSIVGNNQSMQYPQTQAIPQQNGVCFTFSSSNNGQSQNGYHQPCAQYTSNQPKCGTSCNPPITPCYGFQTCNPPQPPPPPPCCNWCINKQQDDLGMELQRLQERLQNCPPVCRPLQFQFHLDHQTQTETQQSNDTINLCNLFGILASCCECPCPEYLKSSNQQYSEIRKLNLKTKPNQQRRSVLDDYDDDPCLCDRKEAGSVTESPVSQENSVQSEGPSHQDNSTQADMECICCSCEQNENNNSNQSSSSENDGVVDVPSDEVEKKGASCFRSFKRCPKKS